MVKLGLTYSVFLSLSENVFVPCMVLRTALSLNNFSSPFLVQLIRKGLQSWDVVKCWARQTQPLSGTILLCFSYSQTIYLTLSHPVKSSLSVCVWDLYTVNIASSCSREAKRNVAKHSILALRLPQQKHYNMLAVKALPGRNSRPVPYHQPLFHTVCLWG